MFVAKNIYYEYISSHLRDTNKAMEVSEVNTGVVIHVVVKQTISNRNALLT